MSNPRWKLSVVLVVVLLALGVGAGQTHAQAPAAPNACEDGEQESGAIYRICMPAQWDGKRAVIYLHGYVAPTEPVAIPEDQVSLPGFPLTLDQVVNLQGDAFVMSSYSTTGFAVDEAMADSLDALAIFSGLYGEPQEVVLLGLSDGALATTLLLERYPQIFRGGVGLCGPYGSLTEQTDYFGDFRVLFDYLFPEIEIANSPIDIAPATIANWETIYSDTVQPVVSDPANAGRLAQLMAAASAAFDPADVAASSEDAVARLLWYNVFATNDAMAKLGGQPFDNVGRTYSGSDDDDALNAGVARYAADAAARTALAQYETTGALRVPFVTLHGELDPIVPYRQAQRYADKVEAAGAQAFYQHIQVEGVYGHCAFSADDFNTALQTFGVLLETIPPFDGPEVYLPVVARPE